MKSLELHLDMQIWPDLKSKEWNAQKTKLDQKNDHIQLQCTQLSNP